MHRWRALCDVPADWGRSTVTIGVFDGVHRGHRQVIGRAVRRARESGTAAVVVTFDPHPVAVLRPDIRPIALCTLEHRLDLFAELGVDATLVLPFTPARAAQPADEFVIEVLVGALHAAYVVVGADFRFGHRAAGDVQLLRARGARDGFAVDAVPLAGEGERFSSTRIRALVAAGDVAAAARALGRPHRVEGPVVRGDHRGHAIGYPTANLALPPETAIPADGIYAGWLTHAGARMPAAISIGTNPTFGGTVRRVEAYVLDRDDLELYGEHVQVDFAERLRDTVRFDSVEALVAQMRIDCDQARELTRDR